MGLGRPVGATAGPPGEQSSREGYRERRADGSRVVFLEFIILDVLGGGCFLRENVPSWLPAALLRFAGGLRRRGEERKEHPAELRRAGVPRRT